MIFLKTTHIAFKIFIGMLCLVSVNIVAQASIPIPQLKPDALNTSRSLTHQDAKHFRLGMRAADNKQWGITEQYMRRLNDPIAIKILKWRMAADDYQVSFNTLTQVSQTQSDWPRMTRIRAKAEAKLFDGRYSANETLSWFMGADPVSGEGRAALARAYYTTGQPGIGDQWLRSAWRDSRLTRDRQKRIYKQYKSRLTKADHAARADHLIWLGRRYYNSAQGLLSLMSNADRALMDARMRVGANRAGMNGAINRVPQSLQNDSGLLYERAKWRRRRKSETYALPVHLQIYTPPVSETGKKKLWREKKVMIYWAIKQKKYTDAYNLTLNHGLSSGEAFADAEFLAGWLALTKLNNASAAATHFATLGNGVSLPVSLGRAYYWQGRAAESLGDPAAVSYYSQAAKYPNVYYGQLAAEHVGQGFAYTNLPSESDNFALSYEFENREIVKAMRMIGEVQNERVFTQFSFHLDDVLQAPGELSLLAKLAKDYGYIKPSVRAAKQAGRLDTMLTESGYPKPKVITSLPQQFDIPFVLAIARQESEFNPRAASSARAYGMMQMINATARSTARKAKIPYQKSWLTSDPEYAARLGSQHLHDLLRDFDGSYIMAAAAYNAGPHRVKAWNKAYGDPRLGQIDPVDWLESLPFAETRNYVQRVMENMEVYRARMNNNQAELKLVHHLNNGAFR